MEYTKKKLENIIANCIRIDSEPLQYSNNSLEILEKVAGDYLKYQRESERGDPDGFCRTKIR